MKFELLIDGNNPNWDKRPSITRMWIDMRLKWAKYAIRTRGYMFLNELREALGLPITAIGQVYVINDPEKLVAEVTPFGDPGSGDFLITVDGFEVFGDVAYLYK